MDFNNFPIYITFWALVCVILIQQSPVRVHLIALDKTHPSRSHLLSCDVSKGIDRPKCIEKLPSRKRVRKLCPLSRKLIVQDTQLQAIKTNRCCSCPGNTTYWFLRQNSDLFARSISLTAICLY